MAKWPHFENYKVMAMHPGWVKTPGLVDALPTFTKVTNLTLRKPQEGADTLLWLALTESQLKNGGFYFDRKLVPIHFMNRFKESSEEIKAFGEFIKAENQ